MKQSCPFCIELENPSLSIWNQKRGNLPLNRIIYENEHWVVVPPLGSFIIGGLLIISKEHYQSCSVCTSEMLDSLDKIVKKVNKVLSKKYYDKKIIFFEHGPATCGTKGSCCVDHAHINVFPINFDIWGKLPKFKDYLKIDSCLNISDIAGKEYLWIFDNNKNLAFPISGVPSQYIRTIITNNYNFPERWNWQDYLGINEIGQTISDLKDLWK